MRRLSVILAGLAVVPTGLACCHIAGKCDCQPNVPICCKYGLYPTDAPVVMPADASKTETVTPAAPPAKMPPAAGVGSN